MAEANWTPVPMLDLRRFKESIVSYGMHSPFVKQTLNIWSVCNRIILKDLFELVNNVLDPIPQIQWSTWLREASNIIEQWSKPRGIEISQDQIFGEEDYSTVEQQAVYDDHTLDLCHAAVLHVCDKIRETEKKIESFAKVVQGPKQVFMNF